MFYVYVHTKPDGAPFYVGKGSGNRAYDFKQRNLHHSRTTAKYGVKNIGVHILNCESEKHAFACEILQIAAFRKSGHVLANHSDGGEGPSGVKHSPETRRRMSAAQLGNKKAHGNKNTQGHKLTDEHRLKISKALKGNTHALGMHHTGNAKNKISASLKGNKHSLGYSPSIEHREKLSRAMRGIVISVETRNKMSRARSAFWARKKLNISSAAKEN